MHSNLNYKKAQELLEGFQPLNVVHNSAVNFVTKSKLEPADKDWKDRAYLRMITLMFEELGKNLNEEHQASVLLFLENEDGQERILKMAYAISETPYLMPKLIRALVLNIPAWLEVDPDADYYPLYLDLTNYANDLQNTLANIA